MTDTLEEYFQEFQIVLIPKALCLNPEVFCVRRLNATTHTLRQRKQTLLIFHNDCKL